MRVSAGDVTSSFTAKSFSADADNDNDGIVLDPLVVCGPSGVGKGTIIGRYMEEYGGNDKFGFTVSHTTRQRRSGEVDGVHYHFTSHDDMRWAIREGRFLEYAEVHGNLYGTSWDSIKDVQLRRGNNNKRCLLDIDIQGVRRLKGMEESSSSSTTTTTKLRPRYVFIAPPSMQVLEERLQERGTESADSLARRTENAREEMEYGLAPGNFDYIVVNDDLDSACQQFAAVVNEAYPDFLNKH